MSEAARILVVDDDAAVCWALERLLAQEGWRVTVCPDAASARRVLARCDADLVLTDIRMPGESGLDLLAWLRRERPTLPVVVSTAHGTMETAVEAVARGAFDYLPKPLDLERTLAVVRRALGEMPVAAAAGPAVPDPGEVLVGATPAMQEVFRRIATVAATDLGVLVVGPTGSGKELVARALHRHSRRSGGPFVPVNCGALPEGLVESELFGHEAGAFTDAKQRHLGRAEEADGGTLFLDEVAELPLVAQAKLLRFLEDGRVRRVGGAAEIPVSVRVVAATSRDLGRLVEAGAFREDLAWRLRVVSIRLPPLVERGDDLPALVHHLLKGLARRLGRTVSITDAAMLRLRRHSWPGNVRELKHVLEEAGVLASGGVIGPDDLPLPPEPASGPPPGELHRLLEAEAGRLLSAHPGEAHARLADLCDAVLCRSALARTGGNQLRAAELLGINRMTLKKRMDQLSPSTPPGPV